MSGAELLFLSQEDVAEAGGRDMDLCLGAVEEALRLHSEGDVRQPHKAVIQWSDEPGAEETEGRVMAMPAYVGGAVGLMGLKWIPSVPKNPARGLPRGIGLIVLSDPETGLPLAVMDGTIVSAMRTGAVSGIAARLLAPPGSAVVTLLGAGVQALTQLEALERSLPGLEQVRIYDLRPERSAAFCERERGDRRAFALDPVESAEQAVRGAQVVVACSMAAEPFVEAAWLDPGSLALSVSSVDFELDCARRADLVAVDDWELETSHPIRPLARLAAEGMTSAGVAQLGDVLTGRHPGRPSPAARIFCSPIGMAVEDVAAAASVYRRALEQGLGRRLELWRKPLWV